MKSVLVFLLGCVVGGAALWLVTDSSDGADNQAGLQGIVEEPAVPDLSSEAETGPSDPPPLAVSGDFREALSQALRLAPAAEREDGDGRFYGRITFPDGEPVKDATIEARGLNAPKFVTPEGEAGDAESWLLSRRWRSAQVTRTYSDADGNYAIEGLPTKNFQLSVKGEGLRFSTVGSTYNVKPDLEINWTAERLVGVEVEVVDLAGEMLESATISTTHYVRPNSTSGSFKRWSRSKPVLYLVPGNFDLFIESRRNQDAGYKSDPVRVHLREGIATEKVRLTVRPVTRMSVTVKVPSGYRSRGSWLEVCVRRLEKGEEPSDRLLASKGLKSHTHEGDLSATFSGIDPGDYHVGVLRHDSLKQSKVVTVLDEPLNVELVLPEEDISGAIIVDATAPGGEPVAGLNFNYRLDVNGGFSSSGFTVLKELDGRYWLESKNISDSHGGKGSKGSLTITADHPVHGKGVAQSAWPVTGPLSIEWKQPCSLIVHVPGGKGHPYGAELSLVVETTGNAQNESQEIAALNSEESLVFSGLTPGKAKLSLQGAGSSRFGGHSFWRMPIRELDLGQGEQHTSVTLPRFGRITVFAASAKDLPERLQVRRIDAKADLGFGVHLDIERENQSSTELAIDALPVGRYQISEGFNQRSMMVDMVGDMRIEWKPREPNAMQVSVTDPEGGMAAAGFQDGDIIIGIDGKTFNLEEPLQSSFARVIFGGKEAKLLIIRAGQRVNVDVNFSKFRRRMRDPGGGMQPVVH